MNKRILLKVVYHMVGVTLCLNFFVTLFLLLWNPFKMSFAFLLIFQEIILVYNFISYYSLFIDSVPIIPLFIVKVVILTVEYAFKKHVAVDTVLVLVLLDILVTVTKIVKGLMFPFVKEERTHEEDEL